MSPTSPTVVVYNSLDWHKFVALNIKCFLLIDFWVQMLHIFMEGNGGHYFFVCFYIKDIVII